MAKRFTDTNKFNDVWYRKLPILQKVIWEYLLAECNHAGILENFDIEMISFKIGAEITESDFDLFKDRIEFIDEKTLYIPKFIEFQYGSLNPQSKVHSSVIKELEKYSIHRVPIEYGKGIDTLKDKDKDEDKDKEEEKKQVKEEEKENVEIECFGEYKNVTLVKGEYGKLLAVTQSSEFLNEVINDLGVNIRTGKEKPYNDGLPHAHYERLRAYIKQRKKNSSAADTNTGTSGMNTVSDEDVTRLKKHFKDKENPAGYVRYLIEHNDHVDILKKLNAEEKQAQERASQTTTYIPSWKQEGFKVATEDEIKSAMAKVHIGLKRG